MNAPLPIRVSALHDGRLARDLAAYRPTHVVSLFDPSLAAEKIPSFGGDIRVFQRAFFDVEDSSAEGPIARVVEDLLAFLSEWSQGQDNQRLLSHCHMGASRSTAAAYLAAAMRHGPGAEAEAFQAFLGLTNKPWPNIKIVALADDILSRKGALIAPLEAYRRTYPKRIDAYHRLNQKRGLYR